MQALHVREPKNIVSCVISLISIVYGLGDFLALAVANWEDYPFSKTVWGVLSIFVDTPVSYTHLTLPTNREV